MILSIPQQIQRALLSGNLDQSLDHLRVAVTRDELGVVSEELKIVCLSNVLRNEQQKGRITVEECILVATGVFGRPFIPLAALLVLIRMRCVGNLDELVFVDDPILETLDVLALETQALSDAELLAAAYAISR